MRILKGFRDYAVNGPQGELGPTIGPGRRLLIQGLAFNIVNGVSQLQITTGTISSGADGLVDNVDENSTGGSNEQTFFFLFTDTNGNGIFDQGTDPIIGVGTDFNDHTFNIRFNTRAVRNQSETDGIEIMRDIDLDNSYLPVKSKAIGSILLTGSGTSSCETNSRGTATATSSAGCSRIAANILGPQISPMDPPVEPVSLAGDGRFEFATTRRTFAKPSAKIRRPALNRLVGMTPTAFAYGKQVNTFSPLAEWLPKHTRYRRSGLKLGYTGIFIDNITRSSQVVSTPCPTWHPAGRKQNMLINGVDFGLEAVY
jgi:hypothetical protein